MPPKAEPIFYLANLCGTQLGRQPLAGQGAAPGANGAHASRIREKKFAAGGGWDGVERGVSWGYGIAIFGLMSSNYKDFFLFFSVALSKCKCTFFPDNSTVFT